MEQKREAGRQSRREGGTVSGVGGRTGWIGREMDGMGWDGMGCVMGEMGENAKQGARRRRRRRRS
jgi:hypothetical protein